MNKLNKKSIVFSSQVLAILALTIFTMPTQSHAITCGEGGCNTVYSTTFSPQVVRENNPKPIINSISPSSTNIGVGTKTITITGEGFVSNSIVRINGSNRPTTFIDNAHMLLQITGNDTLKYVTNGGFFLTVFNGAPGGGSSNTAFFAINNTLTSGTTNTNGANNVNNTSTNFMDINPTENDSDNNNNLSNLASNAFFGSNGILPSGLIQWMFVAILVLLIVILVRRVHGADRKYHAMPMKHD